ncbi:MAG TPA: hypothetical protein PKC91_07060 [Ignavibacteria bacterium]|nr:hypothetical protein [Ignavibacteria bacterium]
MLKSFLLLISIKFFIFILPANILPQSDWSRIVYYNSSGENSAETKNYYIITIRSNGSGKLEYYRSGKVNEYEFQSGKKSMESFNSLLKKSGIFKVNPDDLKSDARPPNSVLNMTLYFEKTKENYLHYNGKEFTEEEIEEKRKEPFLSVPAEYNLNYAEMINGIYTGLEFLVPDKIWEKAEKGE